MIRLDNVSKYYVGNNEVALGLRKINLEFTKGELVAITGESGSGKSTLLNVLSGSDTYEEGELYINGSPTSYYDEEDWERYRRENIGFIYQSYNLIDSYTVFENVNIALVIKGNTGDNTERVMEYLDRVGLREHANKKATQLSSGQKQRLAIARALAKETDIIVADEPTGNLDSENSAEIMKLLYSIAEDKLIIAVTHNYDEIEPYATRKIRMYDGEVAEDIILREKRLSGSEKSADKNEKKAGKRADNSEAIAVKKAWKKKRREKILKIDSLNRKNKPVTFAFLLSFMTAVAAAFYILLGSFFSNLDNTTSKVFDSSRFDNKDINRLIVMKEDGTAFTDEDVEEINAVAKVAYVDKYDCLNDTFYLLKENEDYQYYYHKRTDSTDEPSYTKPTVITGDKYMKSVTCIDEDDLAAGSMPEEIYDIAVYSEDEDILGTTVRMYLGNNLLWGSDLAEVECRVTAILKEETDQIYFSEKMGQMLCANPNKYLEDLDRNNEDFELGSGYNSAGVFVSPATGYEVDQPSVLETVIQDVNYDEEFLQYVESTSRQIAARPIFLINEELTGNEAIVSNQFMASVYTKESNGIVHGYDFYDIVSFGVVNNKYDVLISQVESKLEEAKREILQIKTDKEHFFSEMEYQDTLYSAQKEYDEALEEYNELTAQRQSYRTGLVVQQDTTLSTTNVIFVSREFYEQEIGIRQSVQMAVYLDDYAYADKVLSALNSRGYVAASVYRLAAVEYDWELVERKAVSMFISLGAFVAIFFIGVFILGMIMNLGARDYKIFRLLGIERNELNSIDKTGIILNMIMAVIISFVIIFILDILEVSYIVNIVKYYRWYFYLIYIAALVLFCLLLYVRSKARVRRMNGR